MFLHMSLKEDKNRRVVRRHDKKERPGIFFSRKKQLDRLLFFFIFYQIGLNIKKQLL